MNRDQYVQNAADLLAGYRITGRRVCRPEYPVPFRPEGTVPACSVCGYEPPTEPGVRVLRPHNTRVMTRDGVRAVKERCAGSLQPPEFVIKEGTTK